MKSLMAALLVMPVGLIFAEEQKAAQQKPPHKAAVNKPETEVPAGAKQIGQNRYRYTANGKNWIYVRTPFGLSKHEETAEDKAEPAADAADPQLTIEEDGDVLHFRRKNLFGESRWTRRKSELTEEEKAAWEQSKKRKVVKPASKE